MARTKLNEEEMTFLAPLEPKLKTAVEARWVSHLPQSAIDGMLGIWENLTGTKRPFRQGCGTCILHLCIDLGTLYFAQKPQKKQEKPQNATKGAKGNKTTAGGRKSASGKNRG